MEIKTEADHNDLTECSHDDKPSTGMITVYFLSVYSVYLVGCFLWPARKSYLSMVFIYFCILVEKKVKYVEEF